MTLPASPPPSRLLVCACAHTRFGHVGQSALEAAAPYLSGQVLTGQGELILVPTLEQLSLAVDDGTTGTRRLALPSHRRRGQESRLAGAPS
jgi:hypothetical protein